MRPSWITCIALTILCGCHSPEEPKSPVRPSGTPTQPTAFAPANTTASSAKVEAHVVAYAVSPGFANVVNFQDFQKRIKLTADQQDMLQRNLMVCTPSDELQLHTLYERNEYLKIPSFVTTDVVLHLYHIFYDYTLRSVEAECLLPVLKDLTKGMLDDSMAQWREAKDAAVKHAALKNTAYFTVAARSLGMIASAPPEAEEMGRYELGLIAQHGGRGTGAIFPYEIDYSQFVPRGHYTRSKPLERYFTAMMWYGLAPFTTPKNDPSQTGPIMQGLLIARSLKNQKLRDLWSKVYEPAVFYVGSADDYTPADWLQPATSIFGDRLSLDSIADQGKFAEFVKAVKALRPARIRSKFALGSLPNAESQLRFMGQRYIPDSEVLQRMSSEQRLPSPLDVMHVLGSPRALGHLKEEKRDDMAEERQTLAGEFTALPPETWASNLYWSWLHSIRSLLDPMPDGFPSFMRTEAWQDKSLQSALGSWAELRHDTILYGKQSVAECGDGETPPLVKGYVEPNLVFYDRMIALTKQSREGLDKRGFLKSKVKSLFEKMEDLLVFLRTVSNKELRNETLTREEYEAIRVIGGQFEQITLDIANGPVLSDTDKDMALVADVHTQRDQALEVAVGHANAIFVIVPIEGKLYLTRGAVFSYFEFLRPASDRLTDEKWQKAIKARQVPPPPPWTRGFLSRSPSQEQKNIPTNLTYSTGC